MLPLRIQSAIVATKQLHPEKFTAVFREKVNMIFQEVDDDDLIKVMKLLLKIGDIWSDIAPNVRNRLENYVYRLPHLYYLGDLLDFLPLAVQARQRLAPATIDELNEEFFFELHELIAEKYIQHYLESNSYAEANERSKALVRYVGDLSEPQQRRIIAGIDANAQIRSSFEVGRVISALRGHTKLRKRSLMRCYVDVGSRNLLSTTRKARPSARPIHQVLAHRDIWLHRKIGRNWADHQGRGNRGQSIIRRRIRQSKLRQVINLERSIRCNGAARKVFATS
jgi:hypothetical protein